MSTSSFVPGRAPLKTAAPSSARNAALVTAALHGFARVPGGLRCAPHRLPFHPQASSSGERPAGERFGFLKTQATCALAEGKRAPKGDAEMPRYKSDPHWISVRFKGNACVRCKRLINPGERAFYYPEGRSLYCDGEECGRAASREFNACALDDEN